jgi:prolyl-tRNA synthetase
VPLRIEIGPRDVAKEQVTLARRDRPGRAGKTPAPMVGLVDAVRDALDSIQADLYQRALDFRQQHTAYPEDLEGLREAVDDGFAIAWWCGEAECELRVKEETSATIRCIPMDQGPETGPCVVCGETSTERAVFGRAY